MATEQTQEKVSASLQDFEFDDTAEWFGQKVEQDTITDAVIKEVKADKPKGGPEATDLDDEEDDDEPTFFGEEKDKTPKKDTKKKDDDEEEDLSETEMVDDKDKKKDPPKGDDEDDDFYSTLASELKEKGIFQNVELKEGEKLTEEKFFELQDAEVEARVQDTFDAFFEQLDEDGKKFLKFKKDGGDTADFLATYQTQVDFEALDLENPEHVTTALRLYLTNVEKLEGEDLTDRLAWLKEGGKEKTYAAKYVNDAKKAGEKQREALLKAQEKLNNDREESRKKFNESLVETAAKTEQVGDFVITKAEQKELGTYLTKPTVKVGKNKYIPAFQAEMAEIFKAETPEAKQKLILVAKLVKTNFDVTDLKTRKKTEVIKNTESKLKEAKAGVKTKSSGGGDKRSLEDYF
jgi:hypothetical protein